MNSKILGLMAAARPARRLRQQGQHGGGRPAAARRRDAGGVVPGSQEDLVANVGDRVFYALDSSSLSSDARGTLDRQSAWLGRYPQVSIQIAGNCDERGTAEYNIALGQRRANAARDYLVARGVSSARITTISYGKERPTALGSDEQAYSQNRNATRPSVPLRPMMRRLSGPVAGRRWPGCALRRRVPLALAQMDSREGIALQNQILELRRDMQALQQQRGGGALPAPVPRGGGGGRRSRPSCWTGCRAWRTRCAACAASWTSWPTRSQRRRRTWPSRSPT